jgi:hypothetical protein
MTVSRYEWEDDAVTQRMDVSLPFTRLCRRMFLGCFSALCALPLTYDVLEANYANSTSRLALQPAFAG